MAKRVRGQRSTHRPGGVGAARPDRDPSTPPVTGSSASPSSAASASTSASIVSPVASEDGPDPIAAAPASRGVAARGPALTRDVRPRTRLRSSGLEQKAAAETGWVIDDLRRIAVISAIMLVGLAVAWVLLAVVGLGDFY